jgi:hypothetical protein
LPHEFGIGHWHTRSETRGSTAAVRTVRWPITRRGAHVQCCMECWAAISDNWKLKLENHP